VVVKSIGQLLQSKEGKVVHVTPDQTVFDALMLMAKHEIGAVLVVDAEKLTGIFSERDYARRVTLQGRSSREIKVREVMTEKVYYVHPKTTVEEGLALMTNKRVRHLPVLDADGKIVGIVSIGDLVKETISQQEFIIKQLEAYILR
jgi:CBS domain-containing protein